tara:strand:+ start:79 stop:408 length:330 start_codon:yes stop_codon:yes gene_type:complete
VENEFWQYYVRKYLPLWNKEIIMARYHNRDGVRVQFTAEEESARDAEEAVWEAAAPERALAEVRAKRAYEYPSFGDLFDSLAKKEAGNSTEWDALMVARAAVKTKYPKS